MSDSDDFGGLAPTTPHPPAKRKASKPPSNRGAGPSNSNKPPSNGITGGGADSRKRQRTVAGSSKRAQQDDDAEEDSDVRGLLVNEIEGEEVEEDEGGDTIPGLGRQGEHQGDGSKKPLSKDSTVPTKTAAQSSKAKGKQKAVPVANGKRPGKKDAPLTAEGLEDQEDANAEANADDAMEVDEPAEAPVNPRAPARSGGRQNPATKSTHSSRSNPPPPKRSRAEEKLTVENARLKEDVERLKGHIEDLKSKFEELMHTRQTEPENLMEEMAKNHERQISVQNELIKDLTSQLAKKEPLLRPGKKSSIGLISRDDMEQEVNEYKAQIQHFKNELNSAKQALQEKDTQVADLKQIERELRFELKTEIQRTEQLSKQNRNPPGSASRGTGILKGEDPKHTKVVSLYEDLTNILVHTVKCNPGQHDGDEWVFTCIYTWRDDLDVNVPEKSLNFALRMCKEPSTDAGGALIENVHYLPLNLEMEKPEFVDNLGFLNKPFSFPKTQLSLFVRTLYDNLNASDDDD